MLSPSDSEDKTSGSEYDPNEDADSQSISSNSGDELNQGQEPLFTSGKYLQQNAAFNHTLSQSQKGKKRENVRENSLSPKINVVIFQTVDASVAPS